MCELLNECLKHICRIDTRRDAAAFACVHYALDCSLWKTVLRQTCITVGILSALTRDCCKSSCKDLFWT